ncbi:MAG: FtsX-like permease family protein [Phycisphaerae bacterium]|jgi:hypothetical protein
MHLRTLILRSLAHHWRSHVPVALGAAVGAAVLTGALLVGDSVRGSLRELALSRLGRVAAAVHSGRFFQEALAETSPGAVPAILLRGAAENADTQARAGRVNVWGVDARFWSLGAEPPGPHALERFAGQSVIVNQALAETLGVREGGELLLRLARPNAVSAETLLGRRDRGAATVRLAVRGVLPDHGVATLELSPRPSRPLNAFVPLVLAQRTSERPGRVNTLLLPVSGPSSGNGTGDEYTLAAALRASVGLADYGLNLRVDPERGYVALESEAMLIEPTFEDAAGRAAAACGADFAGVLAYLANEIALEAPASASSSSATADSVPRSVPYSTVAAVDPASADLAGMLSGAPLRDGELLLNSWTAAQLGAVAGDSVTIRHFVLGAFGSISEQRAAFRVRAIVPLEGAAADAGFVPAFPGVTDSDRMSDWDPPFPIDFGRIRPADEEYWEAHRATPKAFVTLGDGQRLWADRAERFGRLTSIRFRPADRQRLDQLAAALRPALLAAIDPETAGLVVDPVRRRALAGSAGTTDFSSLFLAFSVFLIFSAAMLVALLFRLGVERRAGEIGTLLALGFRPRLVRRALLAEGALLGAVGALVGLLLASAYARLMLAGLRGWWSAAVPLPLLQAHGSFTSYAVGAAAGLLLAAASIAYSLRGLMRLPPRQLLTGGGATESQAAAPPRLRATRAVAAVGIVTSIGLAAASYTGAGGVSASLFFGSGAALLAGLLAAFRVGLSRPRSVAISRGGRLGWVLLALRGMSRQPRRCMLTAGLLASATFLIVSLGAFRLEVVEDYAREGPTGGFLLYAESAVPILADLNDSSVQDELGLRFDTEQREGFGEAGVQVLPFRLRDGDPGSCLNPYVRRDPRILGASEAFIERGGFRFAGALAATASERANPWLLLGRRFPDGAIAAIGDEASVRWQFHLGLGHDLSIADERGRPVRLRFVALLAGSALQDEIIIAEPNFERLFPSIVGRAFFLIEAPRAVAEAAGRVFEQRLSAYGLDAARVADRVRDYSAVQNTFLVTFQQLGALGLLLGSAGLAVVILRNTWERRAEIALLRALGFRAGAVAWIVLAEGASLIAIGLAIGFVAALVSAAPVALARPADVPWRLAAFALAGVGAIGLGVGAAALHPVLRAPIVAALRRE